MNFPQAIEYLESFNNFEQRLQSVQNKDFQLDRIRQLLDLLGNPHLKLKTVHVAGSKGKGSTCAMIASILEAAGYKTGLYTSPHLYELRERICILGQESGEPDDLFPDEIKPGEFAKIIFLIQQKLSAQKELEQSLTYFEILTAVALIYFDQQKTDIVVLETGLGGRLDATNVVPSLICVLTPISLEHTQILGATLEAIAVEKAAIIKDANQKVVIAPQEKAAKEIILKRCAEFGIQPIKVGEDVLLKQDLKLPLLGFHQIINATTAIAAVELLKKSGFRISEEHIRHGLENVLWPGRFEIVANKPTVILDSAHSPDSCKALVRALEDILPGKKVTLVLGVSQDKDIQSICRVLNEITAQVIVTKAFHPRAADISKEILEQEFEMKNYWSTRNIHEALKLAYEKTKPEGIILVTGSIFVVSEARKELIK